MKFIYLWFKSQKRETKIILIALIIIVVVAIFFTAKAAYWKWQYFKGLETQIEVLEGHNKNLKKEYDAISIDRKVLQKNIDKLTLEYEEIKKQSKSNKDEIIKKPDVVRTYSERKLDSIIANHKHSIYKRNLQSSKN